LQGGGKTFFSVNKENGEIVGFIVLSNSRIIRFGAGCKGKNDLKSILNSMVVLEP
jgi:hypothetical protein